MKTILIATLAIAAIGCGVSTEGQDAASVAIADATPAPPPRPRGAAEVVRTTTVRPGTIEATVVASGSVIAPRETALGPEVPGRLVEVMVDVGDSVKEGQAVFRIDLGPYRVAWEESKAGLELAKAELAQANQELDRVRRLADQQIAPQQELDMQLTRHAVQKARVQQASARVQRSQQDLERTLVRAPYDSSVVERRLHEGAMLGAGSVVLTLQQNRGFEAVIDIPEAAKVSVVPGHAATLFVEGAAESHSSSVRAVNARIDAESRTYEARIPISDAVAGVKAGAFVRAEISASTDTNPLVVDRDALLSRDGRTYVFLRADSVVEQVVVTLGGIGPLVAEVRSGLTAGDEVVTGDIIERLSDGASIQVAP